MPSLTVTETAYWQERLGRKIDRQIEALTASAPGLLARVGQRARQQALQSLGLGELQTELDALVAQKENLQRQEVGVHQAMLAVVRRVPVPAVAAGPFGSQHPEVSQTIQQRQASHEEELLAQEERGREILRLRREKENLPDTLRLALASPQLKELWRKISALLGEELTPLQTTALGLDATGQSVRGSQGGAE
jgi:hypothetical protein